MNNSACEQLDDYLAGVLSGGEVAAFEIHLEVCAECRHEVDEHRQMTRMLRRGVDELEPVPALLVERTERGLRTQERRRRARLAGGLAAAAVVLIGVGLAMRTRPPAMRQDVADTEAIVEAPVAPTVSAKSLVRVSVLNPDEVIAVPIETMSANVSIVWVYPTLKLASADPTAPSETTQPN